MSNQKYVVPDGGWGWVIVLAFALNNVVVLPIIQSFGMIYGAAFKRYGISATQVTLIINGNQAFGMILGMMNGPLLRKYSYRKVALVGSLLYSIGIISTAFGSSMIHFVITYGMLTSIGMSTQLASFSLAINTYFKEKRAQAMGLAMTITGVGPIVMPYLVSFLLSNYGSEGTMFLMGGLSFNSVIGALLLHPIKWHAKPLKEVDENLINNENGNSNDGPKRYNDTLETASLLGRSGEKISLAPENRKVISRRNSRAITMSNENIEDDNVNIYGFDMPVSICNGSILDVRDDLNDLDAEQEDEDSRPIQEIRRVERRSSWVAAPVYKRSDSFNELKARKLSLSARHGELLRSVTKPVLYDCPEEEGESSKTNANDLKHETGKHESPEPPKKSLIRRFFAAINKFFDLDLLRDPIYVNIMVGMSMAIFAELNFSTLTPFILKDMQLTDNDMAAVMSSLAATDLFFRAVAPYIGRCLNKSPRMMYLFSLFLLITTRTGWLVVRRFYFILVVGIGLGVAKGFRTVYMPLVIPSHVPLEKLPSASSIQSLVNGLFLLVAGPCMGVIRDITGSYIYCIIVINIVTGLTIILWLGEFIFMMVIMKRS